MPGQGLDKIWYLKRINIFSELSEEDMRYVDRHSLMQTFKKGSLIYFSDSDTRRIFFLKKGKVKLYKTDPSGRDLVYAVLKEREVFGSISPIDQESPNEFAQAMEDSMTCVIEKDLFFSFIKDRPTVMLRLNKLLGLKIYELEMLLEELTFKPVQGRIIALFMKLYEKFGADWDVLKMINIPLTHSDIASMIGATRESTTVALNKLKNNGLIESRKKRFYIKDIDRLANFSSM
ncbi:MAG: Crp/Fnr family transcriptional regulator [bacterium]|nr:Crp/Fnr family transcriptional regulator [bacterium]